MRNQVTPYHGVQEWTQTMRSGYLRAHLYFALHKTGVFSKLVEQSTGITITELSEETGVNEYLLENVFEFIKYSDVILDQENDRYLLSDVGKEWIFEDTFTTFAWGAVGGCACIMSNISELMTGEKRYGIDFERPGDVVARGSKLTGAGSYAWILSRLRDLKIGVLADLGCGSAELLTTFCKRDAELKGVGIDISRGALEEAQQNVKSANLEGRVRLVHGDIERPASFAAQIEDVEAINAMMVMHEFLRDGEENLIKILKNMSKTLKGKYLCITEMSYPTDQEYWSMDPLDRLHMLMSQFIVHPFTGQGVPIRADKWLSLLKRADLELIEDNVDEINSDISRSKKPSGRLAHFLIRL